MKTKMADCDCARPWYSQANSIFYWKPVLCVVRALQKVLDNFGQFFFSSNIAIIVFFHFCAGFMLSKRKKYRKTSLLGHKPSDKH